MGKEPGPVLQALRLVSVQIALAVGLGSLLVLLAPEDGFWKLLDHLGIGFFVAAIVTLFWHLREMREFFESLAQSVLVRNEFLKRLNLEALREIRTTAASVILDKVTENPNYDWLGLERWVDSALFDWALPSAKAGSGIYREEYSDSMTLEFKTMEEILHELHLPAEGIEETELRKEVLKSTTISNYRVIAPRKDAASYPSYAVPLSGRASDMPHIPLDQRVRFFVGADERTANEVRLRFQDVERGGITYEGTHSFPFVEGEAKVWSKIIDYTLPPTEPFVLNAVKDLTHGMRVHLTVAGRPKRLVFEGVVMGFQGAALARIDHLPNGISLSYPGWLFEDHGYIIWWWEEGQP